MPRGILVLGWVYDEIFGRSGERDALTSLAQR